MKDKRKYMKMVAHALLPLSFLSQPKKLQKNGLIQNNAGQSTKFQLSHLDFGSVGAAIWFRWSRPIKSPDLLRWREGDL